jgi:2-amino-4-hydroxy-6-hydroxymethyldihydropteridine diphosphokinase
MPEHVAVLALGSNLGESAAILQGAVLDLVEQVGVRPFAASPVFETDPVGGPEQDPYLNAVVLARTDLRPRELLEVTQAIEERWHRTREVLWGPRTLDIDIIVIDGLVVAESDLVVPHPRAHERAFVLVPWLDVDPEAVVPGRGRVADLAVGVDRSGVRPTDVPLSLDAERTA